MVEKKEYQGEGFKAYMSGYREGCKDTTMRLCVDEDGWSKYVSTNKERIIGVVNGKLEVEKLDSDSEDFYKGYYDGVYNAYECYEVQLEHNCPYFELGSCDRSKPCYGCDQCLDDLEEPSTEYFLGYEAGYDKGSALWYESPFPSKQENLWESIGEPMTQEELDKVLSSEEDSDYGDDFFEHKCDVSYDRGYTEGLITGRKMGFDNGYAAGQADMEMNNLVIDGEHLMRLLEYKQQILSYQKTPYNENREFNHALFDIHKGFISLIEDMILDKIFDFWHRQEESE